MCIFKNIVPAAVALVAMAVSSCGSPKSDDEPLAVPEAQRFNHDLELYELSGPVKKATLTSYFDLLALGDSLTVDTLGTNFYSTTVRFMPDGHLRQREHERIRRDSLGRITRWENRRPNVGKVPVGFLKDTLEFRRDGNNLMISDGMGQYAVIVTDERHRITGQYTVPRMNKTYTCAFNVYRSEDEWGNWTERLTIWSTQGLNDSLPSVHYSIDRREIEYYKQATETD